MLQALFPIPLSDSPGNPLNLRLYEQQNTALEGAARLDEYVTRWRRWCRAGLRMLDRSGLTRFLLR